MATRTDNLSLIKPDLDDDADIRVINSNMDTLDNAISGADGAVAQAIATHNTATDAHDNRFSQYLPLSGGQITGLNISRNNDTHFLVLAGANTTDNGAYLQLFAKNHTQSGNKAGDFYLCACDGIVKKYLIGSTDGSLKWGSGTGGTEIKSMAFPSLTEITIPIQGVDSTFIAPANGYVVVVGTSNGADYSEVAIDGVLKVGSQIIKDGINLRATYPIAKGQQVNIRIVYCKAILDVKFIYAIGEV